MNHSAVHDASNDTLAVVAKLESDAHGFVGIPLKLHESDASHIIQIASSASIMAPISMMV